MAPGTRRVGGGLACTVMKDGSRTCPHAASGRCWPPPRGKLRVQLAPPGVPEEARMWLVGPSLLVRPPEMQLLHAVWICPLNPRGGHPPAEGGARPMPCGVPETHGTEPSCCPLLALDWSSLLPACPPVWTKTFTLTPASWGASPPPKVSRAPGSLRMPCRPCLSGGTCARGFCETHTGFFWSTRKRGLGP